jgi:hypothetical protein
VPPPPKSTSTRSISLGELVVDVLLVEAALAGTAGQRTSDSGRPLISGSIHSETDS